MGRYITNITSQCTNEFEPADSITRKNYLDMTFHSFPFTHCLEANIRIVYCAALIVMQTVVRIYSETCLSAKVSGHLSITNTRLLAFSLHCLLTAHSGHLANVDNGQGI